MSLQTANAKYSEIQIKEKTQGLELPHPAVRRQKGHIIKNILFVVHVKHYTG